MIQSWPVIILVRALIYMCNICITFPFSVPLVLQPDLILVLLEMPMIPWMTGMHHLEKGLLGIK